MKTTKMIALFICMITVLMLMSCAPHAVSPEVEPSASEPAPEATAEPTPTVKPTAKPTVKPTATPIPTPTPEPEDGERYDIKRERIRCTIDTTALDMKETWKVNSPTESPDPAWVVESVDGDTVTYSKTDCDHVRKKEVHVPCAINPSCEDTVNYRTATVETAQKETYLASWTLVSEEDGIVTYESEVKCPDDHKKIRLIEDIPCTKNPSVKDAKYTFKIHNSLEGDPLTYILSESKDGFISSNKEDYVFQGMDGDWAVYTYIQCPH